MTKDALSMDVRLLTQAITKYVAGLILVGLLLFLPAGSLAYWQAWLFIAILFVPMLAAGLIMLKMAPDLLRKRLSAREEQAEQKAVIALSGCMFLAAFVIAGLNYRFAWVVTPPWVSYVAAVAFVVAYALYAEVVRENAWLSRTVEVQENQTIVDTGLYGIVRHPMYMSTVLLFLSMPLVLGSPISFAIMLLYLPLIAMRIRNEEQVLEQGLTGYTDYEKRVRYRLIPYVW
jgi:protein-S-isoprenylcysteine O-methyltransferase Ste14